jgi:DNA-binding NarL/FixJ family response regulator
MNIILADDHDLVRETIRFFLERIDSSMNVIEARTFPEAVDAACDADHLELILLDLRMPGMNGFAGLEAMRRRFPNVPTVIISGFVGRDDVMRAIQHGAAGVIPKTLSSKAMLSALKLVLAGETYIPSMVARDNGDAEGNLEQPLGDGPIQDLTAREREVLKLLVAGLTNKEIGKKLGIQEVTVKLHLRGIFRKFSVSNRTQALRIAIQNGWRL